MAWTRSPRGRRRGGRRFFRRRSRYRPTTEQGGRLERCHFNFLVDQPSDNITGGVTSDIVMLVGGASLLGALTPFGTQAAAVARLMQNPLRHYDVETVVFDLDCQLDPGSVSPGLVYSETLTLGFAVNTQRLDGAGAPVTLPPYWESQWPVNQGSGLLSTNEDLDYGTRTHLQRAFALSSHCINTGPNDDSVVLPGRPWRSFYNRVRIKRRISDDFGLFLQFWNRGEPFAPGVENVQWRVSGSLWYRMKF